MFSKKLRHRGLGDTMSKVQVSRLVWTYPVLGSPRSFAQVAQQGAAPSALAQVALEAADKFEMED